MFFARSRSQRTRSSLRSRRPIRLHCEALEGRLVPATLVVLNTDDSGAGSLRQAILDANAMPGDDTITFGTAIAGTMNLQSALPDLSSNVDLEGPGANILTVQRSQAAGTAAFGLLAVTKGATVT